MHKELLESTEAGGRIGPWKVQDVPVILKNRNDTAIAIRLIQTEHPI